MCIYEIKLRDAYKIYNETIEGLRHQAINGLQAIFAGIDSNDSRELIAHIESNRGNHDHWIEAEYCTVLIDILGDAKAEYASQLFTMANRLCLAIEELRLEAIVVDEAKYDELNRVMLKVLDLAKLQNYHEISESLSIQVPNSKEGQDNYLYGLIDPENKDRVDGFDFVYRFIAGYLTLRNDINDAWGCLELTDDEVKAFDRAYDNDYLNSIDVDYSKDYSNEFHIVCRNRVINYLASAKTRAEKKYNDRERVLAWYQQQFSESNNNFESVFNLSYFGDLVTDAVARNILQSASGEVKTLILDNTAVTDKLIQELSQLAPGLTDLSLSFVRNVSFKYAQPVVLSKLKMIDLSSMDTNALSISKKLQTLDFVLPGLQYLIYKTKCHYEWFAKALADFIADNNSNYNKLSLVFGAGNGDLLANIYHRIANLPGNKGRYWNSVQCCVWAQALDAEYSFNLFYDMIMSLLGRQGLHSCYLARKHYIFHLSNRQYIGNPIHMGYTERLFAPICESIRNIQVGYRDNKLAEVLGYFARVESIQFNGDAGPIVDITSPATHYRINVINHEWGIEVDGIYDNELESMRVIYGKMGGKYWDSCVNQDQNSKGSKYIIRGNDLIKALLERGEYPQHKVDFELMVSDRGVLTITDDLITYSWRQLSDYCRSMVESKQLLMLDINNLTDRLDDAVLLRLIRIIRNYGGNYLHVQGGFGSLSKSYQTIEILSRRQLSVEIGNIAHDIQRGVDKMCLTGEMFGLDGCRQYHDHLKGMCDRYANPKEGRKKSKYFNAVPEKKCSPDELVSTAVIYALFSPSSFQVLTVTLGRNSYMVGSLIHHMVDQFAISCKSDMNNEVVNLTTKANILFAEINAAIRANEYPLVWSYGGSAIFAFFAVCWLAICSHHDDREAVRVLRVIRPEWVTNTDTLSTSFAKTAKFFTATVKTVSQYDRAFSAMNDSPPSTWGDRLTPALFKSESSSKTQVATKAELNERQDSDQDSKELAELEASMAI